MSYSSRKRHKECAIYILKLLSSQAVIPDFWVHENDWYHQVPKLTLDEIEKSTHRYDIREINRAARLLHENKHISVINIGHPAMKPHETENPTIILTLEGQDALMDNYYGVLINKDRLESVELKTKWMLPIFSILLSIIALIISLIHKK